MKAFANCTIEKHDWRQLPWSQQAIEQVMRATWEGLQLDSNVKRDFQSSFQLPDPSSDFQVDYLFKLLGIFIYATSPGIWSDHQPELY